MTQATNYKRSFAGSMGAGMKSLFGKQGRRFYELEFRSSSERHRSGEVLKIIVDQVELGRDPKCQIRFGEDCKTVSRRHAAIIKDGNGWKLVQLSQTNSTYLNGRPVDKEWYLQNGDEIQLSTGGPRLGFLVKEGSGSMVKSINLTARLSLFRQQALLPYKRALWGVAAVLVAVIITGSIIIANMKSDFDDAVAQNQKLESLVQEQEKLINNQDGRLDSLKSELKKVKSMARAKPVSVPSVDISECNPYVYRITQYIKIGGEYVETSTSTGFLLEDGRFVTAAHCVSFYYLSNYCKIENGQIVPRTKRDLVSMILALNVLQQEGGLPMKFVCKSPTDEFSFTDKEVHTYGGGQDQIHTLTQDFDKIPAGTRIRQGAHGKYDWAYVNTNKTGGLKFNVNLSSNLKQGTMLYILGYPNGWGQGNPILSTAMCSQSGLSDDLGGTIMASNDNTEGGNSGGPIFIKGEKGWEVVALVSGSTAAKGRFVPLSAIK